MTLESFSSDKRLKLPTYFNGLFAGIALIFVSPWLSVLIWVPLPRKEMLPVILLFVLSLNSILGQAIFDPYTFAESSCSGNYQWSMWFDTNDPTLAQGDFELTNHIQQLFPIFMCASPIAIEVSKLLLLSRFIHSMILHCFT
jgi:hypothetical protein